MSRFQLRRRSSEAGVTHGRRPIREASPAQVAATGAGGYSADPDLEGFRQVGTVGRREVPQWTRERALRFSVAGYRSNPMARAIMDTYTSFCVGGAGVSVSATHPEVRDVVEAFWSNPRNGLGDQDLMLRTHLLQGESIYELIVGETFGTVRRNPIDPSRLRGVRHAAGNPLWPDTLVISPNEVGGTPLELAVVQPNEVTGVRRGEAMFWASFKALETDTRGYPFLAPVLDWLDSYDQVMSNLVDRTALLRYIAFQVKLEGKSETEIEEWAKKRGGYHAPRSGTVEVTNEKVEWQPLQAQTGSHEDTNTAKNLLTSVAAGTGLSKPWLAEPGDSNRGTSMSMSEPVRRRVAGVQSLWLGYLHELAAFAVDQAVLAGLVDFAVELDDGRRVPAAETITVTGPDIAAADAKITAQVLNQLSNGIEKLVRVGAMSPEAAKVAVRKAWEDFVGVPYRPELDGPDADLDDVATAVEDAGAESTPLVQVAS